MVKPLYRYKTDYPDSIFITKNVFILQCNILYSCIVNLFLNNFICFTTVYVSTTPHIICEYFQKVVFWPSKGYVLVSKRPCFEGQKVMFWGAKGMLLKMRQRKSMVLNTHGAVSLCHGLIWVTHSLRMGKLDYE